MLIFLENYLTWPKFIDACLLNLVLNFQLVSGFFCALPPYVGVSNFLGGDQFPIPTRYKISVWGGPVPPTR